MGIPQFLRKRIFLSHTCWVWNSIVKSDLKKEYKKKTFSANRFMRMFFMRFRLFFKKSLVCVPTPKWNVFLVSSDGYHKYSIIFWRVRCTPTPWKGSLLLEYGYSLFSSSRSCIFKCCFWDFVDGAYGNLVRF